MIHAKNYQTVSKFVKVNLWLKYAGLFFPDTVYIIEHCIGQFNF